MSSEIRNEFHFLKSMNFELKSQFKIGIVFILEKKTSEVLKSLIDYIVKNCFQGIENAKNSLSR